MLFSVLVPVYNAEQYLKRCLDAIIGQDFRDYEVVLVNDGSTDGSGGICDTYAGEYPGVICVLHQENKGALLTRRAAMKAAKGDYFVIPDADDYIYPYTLSAIAKAVGKHDCDLVLYDFDRVDLHTKETRLVRQLPQLEAETEMLIDKNVLYRQICVGNTASTLNAKAFSRNLVDWETDYEAWGNKICVSNDLFQVFPIVTNAQKVAYIAKSLYCYNKVPDSLTTGFKREKYDSYMEVYRRREHYMELWGITQGDRETARRSTFSTLGALLKSAYRTSRHKHDFKETDMLVEKFGDDDYLKEHYLKNKKRMSKKNKLIVGNAVSGRKWFARMILRLESMVS